jgi:competence protein ComEC
MGTFSIVSLPVNLLVLPLIPLTMLSGFLTGVISLITPLLGFPFAYATYALLHYVFSVSHFFGTLPFATISIPNFGGLFLAIAYILLALCIGFFWYKSGKKQITKST